MRRKTGVAAVSSCSQLRTAINVSLCLQRMTILAVKDRYASLLSRQLGLVQSLFKSTLRIGVRGGPGPLGSSLSVSRKSSFGVSRRLSLTSHETAPALWNQVLTLLHQDRRTRAGRCNAKIINGQGIGKLGRN